MLQNTNFWLFLSITLSPTVKWQVPQKRLLPCPCSPEIPQRISSSSAIWTCLSHTSLVQCCTYFTPDQHFPLFSDTLCLDGLPACCATTQTHSPVLPHSMRCSVSWHPAHTQAWHPGHPGLKGRGIRGQLRCSTLRQDRFLRLRATSACLPLFNITEHGSKETFRVYLMNDLVGERINERMNPACPLGQAKHIPSWPQGPPFWWVLNRQCSLDSAVFVS